VTYSKKPGLAAIDAYAAILSGLGRTSKRTPAGGGSSTVNGAPGRRTLSR
jgi:hypothetical protein